MGIFFQMTTLIFLAAAAPASFIATPIIFFFLSWLVVKKTIQYFHFSFLYLQFFPAAANPQRA